MPQSEEEALIEAQMKKRMEQSPGWFTKTRDAIKGVPGVRIAADTPWHVNPTGKFVIGGLDGDAGPTGCKIIVDIYGCAAPPRCRRFFWERPDKS